MSAYSTDPAWADVVPVPQDDGPDPVCPIAYTAAFVETMSYFRAVLAADERSQRALKLTRDVIHINPANYTAWYFRRLCLEALGAAADWDAELSLCDDVAMDQQKNYQVWHHRQTVIGRLGPREGMGERDFALCDRMLKEDSKNYHVWSYRQWAVVTHDAWERELRFVEECIRSDVRNNSAWNQRFWLGERQRWWESAEISKREWDYAMTEAGRAPNNESPWLYMTGILRRRAGEAAALATLAELRERAARWPMCVPLRALLVYYCEHVVHDVAEAERLCREELAGSLDSIHQRYWLYKADRIHNKAAAQ